MEPQSSNGKEAVQEAEEQPKQVPKTTSKPPGLGLGGPSLPSRPSAASKKPSSATDAPSTNGHSNGTTADTAAPSQNGGHASSSEASGTSRAASSSGTRGASGDGSTPGAVTAAGGGGGTSSAFMPSLPPRQVVPKPASGAVVDPDEPENVKEVRQRIHDVRVNLLRASQRLGYDEKHAIVGQVLYRLALAEKLKAPWKRGVKRPDPGAQAAREARRLESEGGGGGGGGDNQLGFCVRMMLVGMAGVGKTQLVHALLADDNNSNTGPGGQRQQYGRVDPVEGSTKKVTIHKACSNGIPLEIIDTPGLIGAASGSAANAAVVRQIKKAYQAHPPDLVVYVDRMDAGAAIRSGGDLAARELAALQALTNALGSGFWLNTIVAVTHAGAPRPYDGVRGEMNYDMWTSKRSHAIQLVIRAASGDSRLMNPMAFVESLPSSSASASGRTETLLPNGVAWKPHMLLMVVSAKLLADTENMLQMQEDGKSAQAAQAEQQRLLMAQMMGATGRSLPLPYLCTQMTQFSQPLRYPDHEQIMQVRQAEARVRSMRDPRQRKLLTRQVKAAVLQMKQAKQHKDKMANSFKKSTLAGSKITPEPPRLATKRPPSVHPPGSFRYRVPEPGNSWVVRPSMEPHGYDVGDGIEGLQMERYGVTGVRVARPTKQRHIIPFLPFSFPSSSSSSTQTPATSISSQQASASTSAVPASTSAAGTSSSNGSSYVVPGDRNPGSSSSSSANIGDLLLSQAPHHASTSTTSTASSALPHAPGSAQHASGGQQQVQGTTPSVPSSGSSSNGFNLLDFISQFFGGRPASVTSTASTASTSASSPSTSSQHHHHHTTVGPSLPPVLQGSNVQQQQPAQSPAGGHASRPTVGVTTGQASAGPVSGSSSTGLPSTSSSSSVVTTSAPTSSSQNSAHSSASQASQSASTTNGKAPGQHTSGTSQQGGGAAAAAAAGINSHELPPVITWEEGEEDLLSGAPVHHFLSAQATKGQILLQGKSETTLYHDPLGVTTTSLSAELQTTGTPGVLDALVSLRADVRRKRLPWILRRHKLTPGVLATRLAEGGRLDKGPLAVGLRLQDMFAAQLGRSVPLDVMATGAIVAAPFGTTSRESAAALTAMGGAQVSTDPEFAIGGNLEITADAQALLNTRHATPVALSMNMISYQGETMAAAGASMQIRGKRKDACMARIQISNRGKGGLSLKVHSAQYWWSGLIAMAIPLLRLFVETIGLAQDEIVPAPAAGFTMPGATFSKIREDEYNHGK